MIANKPYRILSFDGGGIRGLVSAVLLERLEQKLGSPLLDNIDMVAGTSTGSLIACGVAKGLDATTIKNLYLKRGIEIFPRFWDVLGSLLSRAVGGYTQPIYDGKGLEKVLLEEFIKPETQNEMIFIDLLKPTLVTSYDTYNRQAVVFKNTKREHETMPVWEVCRASAAAPVAFPAHITNNNDFLEDLKKGGMEIPLGGIPLIDGGVIANDPAVCAIAERLNWNLNPPINEKWIRERESVDLKDIVVASFGTGQPTVKKIGIKEARGWGAGEWANPFNGVPILDVLFDGSADTADYITKQVLSERKYFRFQPTLFQNERYRDKPYQDSPTFNANHEYLEALEETTKEFLNTREKDGFSGDEKLDQLAAALKFSPEPGNM